MLIQEIRKYIKLVTILLLRNSLKITNKILIKKTFHTFIYLILSRVNYTTRIHKTEHIPKFPLLVKRNNIILDPCKWDHYLVCKDQNCAVQSLMSSQIFPSFKWTTFFTRNLLAINFRKVKFSVVNMKWNFCFLWYNGKDLDLLLILEKSKRGNAVWCLAQVTLWSLK